MEEVEPDAQGDPRTRDLGFGYDEDGGYMTGNDTDARDSDEAGATDRGVPEEIPIQEERPEDFADLTQPVDGESQVGLGGATGTERFDEDPRGAGLGSPEDVARTGDADMRTQEAIYHQYEQRQENQGD